MPVDKGRPALPRLAAQCTERRLGDDGRPGSRQRRGRLNNADIGARVYLSTVAGGALVTTRDTTMDRMDTDQRTRGRVIDLPPEAGDTTQPLVEPSETWLREAPALEQWIFESNPVRFSWVC